jgi:hypothetical protein
MSRLVLIEALLAATAASLLAPAPAAADSMPLSALPEKPVRYTQVRGPVPVPLMPDNDRYTITSKPQVCLSFTTPKYWIDGDPLSDTHQTFMWVDPGTTFSIERLIDRGDTAELERIAAVIRYRSIDPTARSRIALHPVAKLDGLTIYAYRWGAKVAIVARTGDQFDPITGPTCGILFEQLVVSDGSSRAVQLSGTVPRTGKRYIVNADISQTSRDPEPLLTVTARLLDR